MKFTKDRRNPDSGEVEPYPPEGYSWYVVGILMLFYALSFVDRQIIALLVEPMKADLGLSDVEMSLLGGLSFAIFYTIFGIPLGRLADSYSRRGLIAAGVALWSLMTTLCGFASRFSQLLLLRMGVGIGEAALSPAAFSMIADYFPRHRRATALSIYSMGIYLGAGLAFTGGAILLGWADRIISSRAGDPIPVLGNIQPWQIVFLAVGIPGLLMTCLLATVKEPRRKGLSPSGGDRRNRGGAGVPLKEVMRFLGRNWKAVFCHNCGLAFLSLAGYASAFWDAAFFERIHSWMPQEMGIWYGILTMAAGAAGVVTGGRLSDWLTVRGIRSANMVAILIASLVWLPFGIAYPMMPNVPLSLAMLFPTLFTGAMPFGCAAAAIQEMMPPRMRAQASALYLFAINIIGLGIGPTAVAFFTEQVFQNLQMVRYSLVLVAGGGHVIAAGLLWLSLGPFAETVERAKQWE